MIKEPLRSLNIGSKIFQLLNMSNFGKLMIIQKDLNLSTKTLTSHFCNGVSKEVETLTLLTILLKNKSLYLQMMEVKLQLKISIIFGDIMMILGINKLVKIYYQLINSLFIIKNIISVVNLVRLLIIW